MGGVAYVKSRTRTAIAIPIHMFGTMHASCCRHSLIFYITPSLHECQHDFLHSRHFLCALGVRTPHVVVRRRVSFVSKSSTSLGGKRDEKQIARAQSFF